MCRHFRQPDAGTGARDVRPGRYATLLFPDTSAEARWGIPLHRDTLLHARSETAARKPTFAPLYRDWRVLLPVRTWSEWSRMRLCNFTITPVRPDVMFAALYQPASQGFVLLTRPACAALRNVHHRQPVALEKAAAEAWMHGHDPLEDADGAPALHVTPAATTREAPSGADFASLR